MFVCQSLLMKYYFLILLCFGAFYVPVLSQNNPHLLPFKESGLWGFIDYTGKVVIPAQFHEIDDFTFGLALAREDGLYGFIDTTGVFVIEPKFEDAGKFWGEVAEVVLQGKNAFIDHGGNILSDSVGKAKKYEFLTDYFKNDELDAPDSLRFAYPGTEFNPRLSEFTWIDQFPSDIPKFRRVMDMSGKILFKDSIFMDVTNFRGNRSFVQEFDERWYLVNQYGEKITKDGYYMLVQDEDYTILNPFRYGYEIVLCDSGFEAIDTSGIRIAGPWTMGDIGFEIFTKHNLMFYCWRNPRWNGKNSINITGFWNIKQDLDVKPRFEKLVYSSTHPIIMAVEEDKKMGYINEFGEYIWKSNSDVYSHPERLSLNVKSYLDFKVSQYDSLATSDNSPIYYNPPKSTMEKSAPVLQMADSIVLYIDTTKITLSKFGYLSHRAYLLNNTGHKLSVSTQNGLLFAQVEALDRSGDWRPIDLFEISGCRNSFENITLPQNQFWEMPLPVFHGSFKTKLRLKVWLSNPRHCDENRIIYSNEIDTNLNDGQFWRTREHFPYSLRNLWK